eukprot:5880389-Prymnesium_polylepis.2
MASSSTQHTSHRGDEHANNISLPLLAVHYLGRRYLWLKMRGSWRQHRRMWVLLNTGERLHPADSAHERRHASKYPEPQTYPSRRPAAVQLPHTRRTAPPSEAFIYRTSSAA